MLSVNVFQRLLGRLSVGRKLTLIYLLDLTAVIFVSSILINEKFIAINFAQKERQGNAYIAATRGVLANTALLGAGQSARREQLSRDLVIVAQAERLHGAGLGSVALNANFQQALMPLLKDTPGDAVAVRQALAIGTELFTRVGNQSNLILDPDLDSYYTMSLSVLRYPELLEAAHGIRERLNEAAQTGGVPDVDLRARYLVLEGRLDASAKGIATDHAEAYAAGGAALLNRLKSREVALLAALEAYRAAARGVIDNGASVTTADAALAAQQALLAEVDRSWVAIGILLDDLLKARIDNSYARMWLHLGTALALLLTILGVVTMVAKSIAGPLRHLSAVADGVRRSGDHTLRAVGQGNNETARLIGAFNDMLDQLAHERDVQKEFAANARAADAQRELVQATPIALVVTAIPGHEVLHANPPAARWLAGCQVDPWKTGMDAPVRGRFFQQLADRSAVDEFEVRWRVGSEQTWAVLSARRVVFQGQDAVLTAFSPINHLKLMERRLELWAKVFETSNEGILIVDAKRCILTANAAFSRHTGYDLQDVIGEKPTLVLPGIDLPGVGTGLWPSVELRGMWHGEMPLRRRNGSEYPAWVMVSAVRHSSNATSRLQSNSEKMYEISSEISHYIFTSIDISDRKKSEQRIQFLAEHDVLTELPNRSLCTERLRVAIQQAQRSGQQVAVLFIDLDRFKDINDTLGHQIGDGLLCSVARRLQESVRAGDTVSRMGGDEFVVVLGSVADVDEVTHVIEQRLIPLVRQPHVVNGIELQVSCSVGIAVYPNDGVDIDTLMQHADTAMYQAKAAGKDGARFYTTAMTERAQARMAMEGALRRALEGTQFRLHWQPRVRAADGTLAGVEGLIRWQHPELGMVSPADFIPLAEETGLIVPIGAWVIEAACLQIAQWRDAGLPTMGVSINLSAVQLRSEALISVVQNAMQRHAIPHGTLELELTESMVMEDAEGNLRQMHALRASGVSLSIDDFGTGYSSLAYLNRFPIDKLKIDRSFVRDMLVDSTDQAITKAIIGLGHTLGLKVVAEGVEEAGQAALLNDAGCDELQGYLFARPMLADELVVWARARPQAAAPAQRSTLQTPSCAELPFCVSKLITH